MTTELKMAQTLQHCDSEEQRVTDSAQLQLGPVHSPSLGLVLADAVGVVVHLHNRRTIKTNAEDNGQKKWRIQDELESMHSSATLREATAPFAHRANVLREPTNLAMLPTLSASRNSSGPW